MPSLPDKLSAIAADIKVAHSVFALPFALLATFYAAAGWPGWVGLSLIVACMVFARTFAMLANRYVDRDIDAENPRTARRALPAGRLAPRDVVIAMAVCAVGLIAGAAGFGVVDGNWWPLIFSVPVLIWLGAYGLFKRFTWLAHFFLGSALAISPLAAGLAIDPASLGSPTLWYLAGFVALWVGGFDVIYALQDEEFDKEAGLHSVPAAMGTGGALLLAKVVHIAALGLLVLTVQSTPLLGQLFVAGMVIVGVLLIVEHRQATLGKFTMAFFTLNGLISLLLGGLGIADILMVA